MQPLFEAFPRPSLKSGVGPLARHGNHQEIIEDLNRCVLHLTQDQSGLGRGHYSSQTQINAREPKRGHNSSHLPGHYSSQACSPCSDMAPNRL